MAFNPQAFNLRQWADPEVTRRRMFQQAAPVDTQTAAQPIIPPQVDPSRAGIIGPLEKYLAENSIDPNVDPNVISGGAGDEVLIGGAGAETLAGRGPPRAPYITPTLGPAPLQEVAVEEPPVPGRQFGLDPDQDNVNVKALIESSSRAGEGAAGVSEPESKEKFEVAKELINAVTGADKSTIDLDTFSGQLEAVGLGDQYTEEDYNEKAKSILGIDQDEEDVPVWAAPLFLFGLNLMQAPVSSQREAPGPLGGLLADVGAAGAAAFPVFGAEIARRRKDRKDIGMLAYQLKTADVAARTAAYDRLWKRQQWAYEQDFKNQKVISDELTKMTQHYTPDFDPDQKAAFAIGLAGTITDAGPVAGQTKHADGSVFTTEEVRKWQTQYLLNPVSRQLLGAKAQEVAGLVPDLKINTIPLLDGVGELSYSPRALRMRAKKESLSTEEMMAKVLKNPDAYPTIALSKAIDWSTQSLSMVDIGGGYIQFMHTDLSTKKVTSVGPKRLKNAPDIDPWTYTGTDGIEHSVYIDFTALKDKRNRVPGYSLQDAITDNNTNIIVGEMENFKDYGSRVEDIPIYTNGRKARAIFDRNKYMEFIRENPDALPDTTNPFAQENFEMLKERGIITPIPGSIEAGEGQEFFSMSADGSVIVARGADAEAIGNFTSGIADATAQKDMRNQRSGVLSLHRIAYEVENILNKADEGGILLGSKITDLKGGFASIVRQVRVLFPGGDKTATQDYKDLLDPSQFGGTRSDKVREQLESAFGKDSFSWIEDSAQRTALRSFLTEAAFSLASSREGGKLTDRDVQYAFDTLGWDGTSWTATPESLLTGLSAASNNQSERYMEKWGANHDPKMIEIAAKGGPGIIEQMLAKNLEMRGSGRRFTEIGRRYDKALLRDQEGELVLDEDGKVQFSPDFSLRFDARNISTEAQREALQEQAAAPEFSAAVVSIGDIGKYNEDSVDERGNIALPNYVGDLDMRPMIKTFTTTDGIIVPPINLDAFFRDLERQGIIKFAQSGAPVFIRKLAENRNVADVSRMTGEDGIRYQQMEGFIDWAQKNLWK